MTYSEYYLKELKRLERLVKKAQKQGIVFLASPLPKTPKRVRKENIEKIKTINLKKIKELGFIVDPETGELKSNKPLMLKKKQERLTPEELHRRRVEAGRRTQETLRQRYADQLTEMRRQWALRGRTPAEKRERLSPEELHRRRVEAGRRTQETLSQRFSPEELSRKRSEWARRAQQTMRKRYTPEELHEIRSEAAKRAAETRRSTRATYKQETDAYDISGADKIIATEDERDYTPPSYVEAVYDYLNDAIFYRAGITSFTRNFLHETLENFVNENGKDQLAKRFIAAEDEIKDNIDYLLYPSSDFVLYNSARSILTLMGLDTAENLKLLELSVAEEVKAGHVFFSGLISSDNYNKAIYGAVRNIK